MRRLHSDALATLVSHLTLKQLIARQVSVRLFSPLELLPDELLRQILWEVSRTWIQHATASTVISALRNCSCTGHSGYTELCDLPGNDHLPHLFALRSISLTSKRLRAAAVPLIFRSIEFLPTPQSIERFVRIVNAGYGELVTSVAINLTRSWEANTAEHYIKSAKELSSQMENALRDLNPSNSELKEASKAIQAVEEMCSVRWQPANMGKIAQFSAVMALVVQVFAVAFRKSKPSLTNLKTFVLYSDPKNAMSIPARIFSQLPHVVNLWVHDLSAFDSKTNTFRFPPKLEHLALSYSGNFTHIPFKTENIGTIDDLLLAAQSTAKSLDFQHDHFKISAIGVDDGDNYPTLFPHLERLSLTFRWSVSQATSQIGEDQWLRVHPFQIATNLVAPKLQFLSVNHPDYLISVKAGLYVEELEVKNWYDRDSLFRWLVEHKTIRKLSISFEKIPTEIEMGRFFECIQRSGAPIEALTLDLSAVMEAQTVQPFILIATFRYNGRVALLNTLKHVEFLSLGTKAQEWGYSPGSLLCLFPMLQTWNKRPLSHLKPVFDVDEATFEKGSALDQMDSEFLDAPSEGDELSEEISDSESDDMASSTNSSGFDSTDESLKSDDESEYSSES